MREPKQRTPSSHLEGVIKSHIFALEDFLLCCLYFYIYYSGKVQTKTHFQHVLEHTMNVRCVRFTSTSYSVSVLPLYGNVLFQILKLLQEGICIPVICLSSWEKDLGKSLSSYSWCCCSCFCADVAYSLMWMWSISLLGLYFRRIIDDSSFSKYNRHHIRWRNWQNL